MGVGCDGWLHDRPTLAIVVVRTIEAASAFLRFMGGAGDARALGSAGKASQTVCTNARKACPRYFSGLNNAPWARSDSRAQVLALRKTAPPS